MTKASSYLKITFVRTDGYTQLLTVSLGESVLIGRDLSCSCRLEGRKVSRRHVRLEMVEEGVVKLNDNGSHNGTFVNTERVSERELRGGEAVTIGEWEGRVEFIEGSVHKRAVPGVPLIPAVSVSSLRQPPISSVLGGRVNPLPRSLRIGGDALDDVNALEAGNIPVGQLGNIATPEKSGGESHTRIVDMKAVWRWEEDSSKNEVSTDTIRAAPVGSNPIVKRFTQSQSNMDMRGLTDLGPGLADSDGAKSGLNIDAVALQLVFKVTESLQRTLSIDEFLVDMAGNLCDFARAKAVAVLLPDEKTGEFIPRCVKNRRSDESVHISRTVLETAITEKAAVATEDAGADARFAGGESVLRFDLKAVLVAPMLSVAGEVLGAVYMTRDLPFSNTERDLVAAMTHLVAMGLDRSIMRDRIAEEARTRRALERFHAPDVVRRLMMENTSPESPAANGAVVKSDGLFLETLEATVLFCDLSGFTKYCESHTPEQVGQLLNLYLGGLTEVVFEHGGTVDKYIGDAIMCIFGAPFGSEHDAFNAVRCAVAMRREFARILAIEENELDQHLKVHIGVNTGTVVAGTVGSSLRMEYTALGDTVNIAARLEGVAKKGQIVIGSSTAEQVQDHIDLNSLGHISLKGRGEEVEVFEVPDQEIFDFGEEPKSEEAASEEADTS
ncbi:MAG: FHA domain-containing protein [Deltaproteobacteria bacterium]|nr:FHA domain-containing protein [Deltaproteobacteria bacterium]